MKSLLVLSVFVLLMTLGGVIPPVLDVFGGWEGRSFSPAGSFPVWRALITTPGFMESLIFTIYVAFVSAAASCLAGVFLAWSVWSLPGSLRNVAGLYRVPVILPHITAAFLTILLWGPTGVAARVLYGLGLVRDSGDFSFILYGGWGGGIILAYWFKETPFVMLLLLSALSQMDRRLLLTAANLGGGRWQTFRSLIWPVLRPSVHTAFLILFLYSAGAFEIPFLLGESRPSMVSIRLYNLLFDKNVGERPVAMAFLLLFFVFCLVFLGLYLRITGKPRYQGRKI